MGLLDDYAIDVDDYDEASYDNPDDGYYDFEIADVFIRKGTDAKPDTQWIIVRYIVGDTGKQKDEWFQIPEDASDPTDKERQSLGFYRSRLSSLGFAKEDHNRVDREDLIGLTGVFKLETRKGFQNIYNLKTGEEAPVQAAPKPAPKAAAPAARPAARPAGRPAGPGRPASPAQRPQAAPAAQPASRAPGGRVGPAQRGPAPSEVAPEEAPEDPTTGLGAEGEAEEAEAEEQYTDADAAEEQEVEFVEPPAQEVKRPVGRPPASRPAARTAAATQTAAAAGVRKNPFGNQG